MQPGAPHSHQPPLRVCPAMAMVTKGAGLDLIPEADEKNIGRLSMQRAANKSLIFTNLSSLKRLTETQSRLGYAALYQQVRVELIKEAHSNHVFSVVGDRLVALAEQAYALRQVDKLEDLSQALLALPLPEHYTSAARYFRGLELIRRGELDAAKSVLEAVAADPPHRYTSRAIQSLGVTFHARGDLESALKLYLEAGCRAAKKGTVDPLSALFTQKNIAVLKSGYGDHRGALADLERMLPLARAVCSSHPQVYYDYLNSLAVEFAGLGRLEEAANTSLIAVSSPIAVAYPEWRQTFDEIAFKQLCASHSAVAVRQRVAKPNGVEEPVCETNNVVHLPLAERQARETAVDQDQQGAQARVLNFQQWKSTIKASSRLAPEGFTAEQRNRMTTGEKLIRLMDLISQDETDDETIDRILEAVEQIVQNRRNEKLD